MTLNTYYNLLAKVSLPRVNLHAFLFAATKNPVSERPFSLAISAEAVCYALPFKFSVSFPKDIPVFVSARRQAMVKKG